MNEFTVSSEQRQAELDCVRQRNLEKERLFVLLLGPSATGKTTVIDQLADPVNNTNFSYVKPFTTRQNRPNETNKISVSSEVFTAMEEQDEFVVVNNLYGERYGTPLSGIIDPLAQGNTPILDYPLETVGALSRPEYDMLKFYIYPPSVEEWIKRTKDNGRDVDGRLRAGLGELSLLRSNNLVHHNIDLSIVNADGAIDETARAILESIDAVVA